MDAATTPLPDPAADHNHLGRRIAELEAALAAQTRRADDAAAAAAEAARARDELRATLDTVLTHIPTGVALFDAELRFISVNPMIAGIDRRASEHYPGQAPTDLHPQFARLIEPYLRRALSSEGAPVQMPLHRISASAPAEARDLVAEFHPIGRADGQPLGVAVIVREETERLRAERIIRERDAQLRLALEAAELGTWHQELASGVITLDLRATEHFGLPRNTVDGATLLAAVRPDDAPLLAAALRAARPDGRSSVELRVARPDGAERWLALHLLALAAGASAPWPPDRLVGTTQDITAQKTAEAALQAAYARAEAYGRAASADAARLLSLLTHAPVGIALMDGELRFQQINAYLTAVNGLPAHSQIGRTIREVLPALADELEAIHHRVLATGEPVLDVELTGETPAAPGALRTWRSSYFPVRGADGALLGTGAVVLDVTAQLAIERALHAEHQQLEAIVQTMGEGVLAFKPDGTIVILNAMARQLALIDAEAQLTTIGDLVAHTGLIPLEPDGQPMAREHLPMVRVQRGERFSNLEIFVRIAGRREEGWRAFSGTPVYGPDGALALAVLTMRDITQRKRDAQALVAHAESLSRSNAELARALRLKDEFLALVSHELRTPLNAVLGYGESMAEELYGPVSERQRHALQQIVESGRHLLGILSDMLDLTHLEAGTVQLEHEPLDLMPLCHAALQQVAARAAAKGLSLRRPTVAAGEGLRGDAARLSQILVNLLDNAVKFTPAGGTVGLELSGDSALEQVVFTVWDTGIGIDRAATERLFQPFTQLDGRLARAHEGIGLGLTLVRRLVALHGGGVRLESAPGQGSRFSVSLPWPLEHQAAPAPAPAPGGHAWPNERPPRVLIADDHEQTIAAYSEQLALEGCEVTTARSGGEAIASVQAARPDLALIAVQLRDLDGLATIRQIRQSDGAAALPIIALATSVLPGDAERATAAGATRYLARPLSARLLLEALRAMLAASAYGGAPSG